MAKTISTSFASIKPLTVVSSGSTTTSKMEPVIVDPAKNFIAQVQSGLGSVSETLNSADDLLNSQHNGLTMTQNVELSKSTKMFIVAILGLLAYLFLFKKKKRK